ncbi:depupylase/deamidase Dop [Alloscardovia omnicolens]|uniref:depupylase/deamidase Dop n=1 Tax=Alloscardovia omnicolens TaxID=419015 RepID=UPI003A72241D
MSVRRVMGSETEYGVSRRGGQYENHAQLSFDVIESVRAQNPDISHVAWNYGHEDPVHDARGYHMQRAHVSSDLLTDREELRATNAPQTNGARIYVDHCHPEYSSPEVLSPREALLYNRAGDFLMKSALERAHDAEHSLILYRNNVDGKGASWGSHENYQISRHVPFDALATLFTAHAVSRQIYTGSGRVGIGEKSDHAGFQLSQRADYFKMKIGLQTTFDRPIVNTRDESHSTDEYRRFHVIVGDANRMDVPELLKMGTTSLLLWALERSYDSHSHEGTADFLDSITLADPVHAMHTVSHDLTLSKTFALSSGENLTAFQLQLRLRAWIYAVAAVEYGTDSRGEPLWPDDDTLQVVTLWTQVLEDIVHVAHSSDDERLQLSAPASRLEWLLKWQICESMRRRKNVDWSSPLVQAIDISWARLDNSSVWLKVQSKAQHLITDKECAHAAINPPESTRAYTRGQLLRTYAHHVKSISWDIAVLDVDGQHILIDLTNPCEHARQHSADTFTAQLNIEEVVSRLKE